MEEISRRSLLNKGLAVLLGFSGLDKLANANEPIDLSDYKVAFTSNRNHRLGNNYWNIYTIDGDGKNEERITDGDSYDRRTCWSHDKKKIAFESNRNGDWNLYLMDYDGRNIKPLTEKGTNICPSFSSDGEKLFFYSRIKSNHPWRIKFMNIDGSDKKTIIDGNWDKFCDESKLNSDYMIRLQTKKISRELGLDKLGELIQSVNSGDSALKALIDSKSGGIIKSVDYTDIKLNEFRTPFISRKVHGRKIVYYSDESGSDDVFIVDADGENKRRLVSHTAGDTNPCLSQDKKILVFDSNRGSSWNIFIKPLDGIEKQLTFGKYFDRFPSVS